MAGSFFRSFLRSDGNPRRTARRSRSVIIGSLSGITTCIVMILIDLKSIINRSLFNHSVQKSITNQSFVKN
jgi:hypothetical protein